MQTEFRVRRGTALVTLLANGLLFQSGVLGIPVNCCLPDLSCQTVDSLDCGPVHNGTVVSDCAFCPGIVPPGFDCWTTPCGQTRFDFCQMPIPPDFFDPGSLPFEGTVHLGSNTTGDTQIQRLGEMTLDTNGAVAQTPIEIVQLDLTSCAPITVTGSGDWDVRVDLSVAPDPPIGVMRVTRTHANGGTFVSDLPVQPRFTFLRVGSPCQMSPFTCDCAANPNDCKVFDTGMIPIPPAMLVTVEDAPWVFVPVIAPGPECAGPNFAAGIEGNPANLPGCTTSEQCCHDVGHQGPGHLHVTGRSCVTCECGACCNPNDGSCSVVLGNGVDTAETVCMNTGGEYKGAGTACGDGDGDGVPDWFETNSCCSPNRDVCNTGTDPNNSDSDGDGVADGVELRLGSDACDANSVPNVPATSEWGLVLLVALMTCAATLVLRRRGRNHPA